ncbi:hypothetical protein D3P08_13125 [Paenibacillus nanensis]|uniref:DUF4064 domain-containing protein n=1 Tax=Paenibacillus nanensis TaxID=393251 RepID=A0A3A1V1J1_9BACL|nr:hypothetical protein [Paenibacillus nanensis]RIX52413.1 hypothetical protein D3P08_13125 [Paenibacillus nanensis]
MTNEYNPNEQNHPQGNGNNQGYPAFTPVSGYPGGGQLAPLKHSGLGIASFVLAIVSILALIIGIIMSVAAAANYMNVSPSDIESEILAGSGEEFAAFVGAGLLMMLSIGLSIIGLVLGIIGLVIKNRKKIFGIIGVILNALLILGLVLLMALGLALG